MLAAQGFAGSLVKAVSLSFFCLMESSKKAVLGLWQFSGDPLGKARWQAAVPLQGMWPFLYPQCPTATGKKPLYLVSEMGVGATNV